MAKEIDWEKYKVGKNLYSVSAYFDDEYGKPGTPSHDKFLEEALAWMREDVGEEEFEKWAEKSSIYA